jgi:hypothetical protein
MSTNAHLVHADCSHRNPEEERNAACSSECREREDVTNVAANAVLTVLSALTSTDFSKKCHIVAVFFRRSDLHTARLRLNALEEFLAAVFIKGGIVG